MFKHEKMLFHPVEVERPNPQYAALLQEQLGGANGELNQDFGTTKAAKMYFSLSEPSPEDSRFTQVAGNPPSFS